MDIESTQSQLSRNQKQIYRSLIVLLEKQLLNLPKALKLSQKYTNQQELCISLLNLCVKNKNMRQRLNIITFLVQLFKVREFNRNFDSLFLKQIINQVYEMRWKMDDQNNNEAKNHLSIIKELMKTLKKLLQQIKSNFTLMSYMRKLVHQYENVRFFTKFDNILFTLKLILLLDKSEAYQQVNLQIQIVNYYLTRLLQFNCDKIETQQIITIAFLNCAHMYQSLGSKLQEFIIKSTFYQKLIIMNEKLPEESYLEFLKLKLCQNQQQLQLITQIVQNKYDESFPSLKRQLCIFWLINCEKLLQINELFDLTHYISLLQPEILSQMVSFLNIELNEQQKQPLNRRIILKMWNKFLLNPKVEEQVLSHKPLFIATELIFYRFVRQIISQIENSLNEVEMEIVLETFSKYFGFFLQQQQCEHVRKKITRIYIQYYAHYLTPHFLIKSKQKYKEYSTQITNLNIFDPELLQLLLIYVESGKQRLLDLLGRLQHEVSVIVLKYITQKNQWEYNQLFNVNQIVQYLFENNIEIHIDKFQYEFYNKISQNVEKYMKIIRKSTHQNRYERFLNSYVLDLLENELLNQSGLKKIPISFTTIIYIVQRFQNILNVAEIKGNCLPGLINSFYTLANRSLFANIPDAYYLLILAIAQLKQVTESIFYDSQAVILQNLIKFIKHYQNHDNYLFFGFASVLLVLYGLPDQKMKIEVNYNWCQQVIVGPFLLQNVGKLLNFKLQGVINRKPEQIQESIANRADLICRKVIIFNLLRRINILLLKSGIENNNEAIYLENLVQKLIDAEIEIEKPTSKIDIEEAANITKKRTKFLYDQDELNSKLTKQQIHNLKECEKRPNSLQKLFDKVQSYDQFKYFKTILGLLRNTALQNSVVIGSHQYANLQRVDGKVRAILHVKK